MHGLMKVSIFAALVYAGIGSLWAVPTALAWDFKAGRDERSGRPFAIIQHWSLENRSIIGIECQNGLESGMLGVVLANPYSEISPRKKRNITIQIGDSAPITISVKQESNPSYTNYVLVTDNKINSALFGRIVEKLQSVPGDIRVVFDDKNQFVFPDEGRQAAVQQWQEKCLSDNKN